MPREMIFLRKPVPTQRGCDAGLGVPCGSKSRVRKEQPLVRDLSCHQETMVNFA